MTAIENVLKLGKEPRWWLWRGYVSFSDLRYAETADEQSEERAWDWYLDNLPDDPFAVEDHFPFSWKPSSDVFGVPGRSRKQRGWYNIRSEPSQPVPNSAGVLSYIRTAADLPPELVSMVVECLSELSSSRHHFALCSLVCRHWAKALRPLLFAELILRSRTDITELLAFLREPLSVITQYIEQVTLAHTLPNAPFLHLLPRLSRTLDARYRATISGPLPDTCNTSMCSIHWLLPRRLLNATTLAFTEVTISDVHIPSFIDLTRLVWELPALGTFRGIHLTWSPETALPRVPHSWIERNVESSLGPEVDLQDCCPGQYWLGASLTGGLLAVPWEYDQMGALLCILDSQLKDARWFDVVERNFTWASVESCMVTLHVQLSTHPGAGESAQMSVSAFTLWLSWGHTRWIASMDWLSFAQIVASFLQLQQLTIQGNRDERNEFMQHAYDHLAIVCPGSKLRLENYES